MDEIKGKPDDIDTSTASVYGQCQRCRETCKLKHMEADLCDRCADGDKVASLEAENARLRGWLQYVHSWAVTNQAVTLERTMRDRALSGVPLHEPGP